MHYEAILVMTSQILKFAGFFTKTQKSRYLENETFFFSKILAWYSCLLYVSGFQKVNRSQISSEVDMEKPLLEKYANLKRMTISYVRKGHLDLRFLLECKKNNLILKFLQFKLANRHLHKSAKKQSSRSVQQLY